MAVAGKVSSSFAMIAAAGLGALCLGAPKLLAQDAQPQAARAPATTKTKPQKNAAAQKPSPVAGQRPAPATPPTSKQGPPAKAPAPQAAPKAAAAPPRAKLPPLPPIDTSTPPPTLPRASRERMRACAEEWANLKRSANANLPMWRDFATGCLTR